MYANVFMYVRINVCMNVSVHVCMRVCRNLSVTFLFHAFYFFNRNTFFVLFSVDQLFYMYYVNGPL